MNFDIVIVGGGLVGASLAAALAPTGLSVALLESRRGPELLPPSRTEDQWDTRIYAISPGGRRLLTEVGAWQHMEPWRVTRVEAMEIYGDRHAELEFNAQQVAASELACIVENGVMHQALWQVLREQKNLTILEQAQCSHLEIRPEAAHLRLEDGRAIQAKLVIGADGRNSWVRNQAGISAAPVDYQQHGLVANFAVDRAHHNIAYEWFQPDDILAFLPLSGNRVSIVWTVSPQRSAELLAMSEAELTAQVEQASLCRLGRMRLLGPAAAFPLRMLVLPRIAQARVALVGDAAHNMHPLAGQGVNMGFRDVQQLVQLLANRGLQTDCGDAHLMRRYDRKRKEDIYSGQAVTYGLKHLFNNHQPVIRQLRNIGLNATNHIAPIKKFLIARAVH